MGIVTASILSVGGGGAIVVGLSSWLGKVWANRLMEIERAKHAQDLVKLQSELRHESEAALSALRTELETYKEKHLKGFSDKLAIYRLVVDVIIDLLATFDMISVSGAPPSDAAARFDKFNRGRMQAYGYLCMLAPQSAIDAMDDLIDRLILIAHAQEPYSWPAIRGLALKLINEIRKDVGIDPSPIEYRGKL